jgi:hypothetical protein
LHYAFYNDRAEILNQLKKDESIQCIVGSGLIPFGAAQQPQLTDYADGVDTMAFLKGLTK